MLIGIRVLRYLAIFFILQISDCSGQIIRPANAVYFSQFTCYSKVFADAFSIRGNPASASLLQQSTVGVVTNNRWMIDNLHQYALSAVVPTSIGNIGMQMDFLHYGDFTEMKLALAYAKSLGKILLGIQFHYHVMHITGYKSNSTLVPELGMIWKVKENVYTGISIYRPILLKKNPQQNSFGYNYSSGIGYEISQQVLLAASISVLEDQPSQLNLVIQYQFTQQFFASLGINCRSNEWDGEAGWKWKSLKIKTMISYHTSLGFSPGLLVEFAFNKPAK